MRARATLGLPLVAALAAIAAAMLAPVATAQATPTPWEYTATNCVGIASALADIEAKLGASTAKSNAAKITLDCAGTFTDCPAPKTASALTGLSSLNIPCVAPGDSPFRSKSTKMNLTITAAAACATGGSRPLLAVAPQVVFPPSAAPGGPRLIGALVSEDLKCRLSLQLTGLRIAGSGTRYGGILYACPSKGSQLTLTDVDISGCSTTDGGGGLRFTGYRGTTVAIYGGTIANNVGRYNGGAELYGAASVYIKGTTFANNKATNFTGGLMMDVARSNAGAQAKKAVCQDCVFTGNTVSTGGSAIFVSHLGKFTLSLPGSSFSQNGAAGSPAVCGNSLAKKAKLTITDSPTGLTVATPLPTTTDCSTGYAAQQ